MTLEDRKRLHKFSIASNVKSVLQPLYVANEMNKEQYKQIAEDVTVHIMQDFSAQDLNKDLTLTPNRKRKIYILLRDELNKQNLM